MDLFIDGQNPDLSLHFNPPPPQKARPIHAFSHMLQFEVHKRIWLQHIRGEAVAVQLDCTSTFEHMPSMCFGMYFFRLSSNFLHKVCSI